MDASASASSSSSSSAADAWDYSSSRALTYLDEDDPDGMEGGRISSTGYVIGFSILTAGCVFTSVLYIRFTRRFQNFYQWNAIRLMLPGIAFFLALENLTFALDAAGVTIISQWHIALYMLEAIVAPGIFLSTFVVTFLAYRTRSIPFCLVERGPGRSSTANPRQIFDEEENNFQPLVRPATMTVMMRIFSLTLFMLTLVVNFDVVWEENDLAGRSGWKTVVESPWNESTAHVCLSLLPIALVTLCCLYFALLMWRYGTSFSMVINSSIFNQWMAPVVGTICLGVGQSFGPDLFPLLSNTGILIYLLCLQRVLVEIRKDMAQAGDLGTFLEILGDDKVTGSTTPVEPTVEEGSDPLSAPSLQ